MSAMVVTADLIRIKRDGGELAADGIRTLVRGIADDSVSDAQVGAFLMAVFLNGMNAKEQSALTLAMRDSGDVLNWDELDGPVLDKHSTGGVGDLISLVLAPLMASCGVYVPMISGRGLGHTGCTLDKLESIPGLDVHPAMDSMRRIVREAGFVMTGQGPHLAPADRRMYAVRDVTATVSCIPLIVSSILSKKLAEGLDGLVMDIKVGNGAFMQDIDHAHQLSAAIREVAAQSGLRCDAVISDMNQPLAWAVGNALEIREALEFMTGGRRHGRVQEVLFALCTDLLMLSGLAEDAPASEAMLLDRLDSGAVAERFARMVAMQGGPADFLERPDNYLRSAPVMRPLTAPEDGWIAQIDTRKVGECVVALGGGRNRLGDTIDHRVGLSAMCSVGDEIRRGQPLTVIHATSENAWEQAAASLGSAIEVQAQATERLPVVYEKQE